VFCLLYFHHTPTGNRNARKFIELAADVASSDVLVDLTGLFWNQVYEQFSVWYKEFHQTPFIQMLVNTKGLLD